MTELQRARGGYPQKSLGRFIWHKIKQQNDRSCTYLAIPDLRLRVPCRLLTEVTFGLLVSYADIKIQIFLFTEGHFLSAYVSVGLSLSISVAWEISDCSFQLQRI